MKDNGERGSEKWRERGPTYPVRDHAGTNFIDRRQQRAGDGAAARLRSGFNQ